MITVDYARTMATYGAVMNRRVFDAAARLDDEARRRDRGAFWRSIHGTLSHLLWADAMWMARFDGWDAPGEPLARSDRQYPDFVILRDERGRADGRIAAWAEALDPAWLAQDQNWYSGAAQKAMRAPRTLLVAHLFNHGTHHRGQVHAMLTAAGETVGATDLPFVI